MRTTVTCEKLPSAEPETVDWEYVRTHEGLYRGYGHGCLFLTAQSLNGEFATIYIPEMRPACEWSNFKFARVTNERITITVEV